MEQNDKNFIKKQILSVVSKYTYQQKPVGMYIFADSVGIDTFTGRLIVMADWVDKCTVIGKFIDSGSLKTDPENWYVSTWDINEFLEKLLEDVALEELYLEVFDLEDVNGAAEDILKEAGVEDFSRDLEPMLKVFKLLEDEDLQQEYKFYKPFKERRVLFKIGLLEEEDFE